MRHMFMGLELLLTGDRNRGLWRQCAIDGNCENMYNHEKVKQNLGRRGAKYTVQIIFVTIPPFLNYYISSLLQRMLQ